MSSKLQSSNVSKSNQVINFLTFSSLCSQIEPDDAVPGTAFSKLAIQAADYNEFKKGATRAKRLEGESKHTPVSAFFPLQQVLSQAQQLQQSTCKHDPQALRLPGVSFRTSNLKKSLKSNRSCIYSSASRLEEARINLKMDKLTSK